MNECLFGDCRDSMNDLLKQDTQVQMCVTSPPYWGLRDYGVDGQLGLEETPEEYIDNMVEVFRLVRSLLKDDGTLWLNIGDSYASQGKNRTPEQAQKRSTLVGPQSPILKQQTKVVGDLKQKDLIGIPWLLAFALRADGWFLRSDIIWNKPNPMPESVKDRPTRAHEYIFLLSKSKTYYYDHEAIKEPMKDQSVARLMQENFDNQTGGNKDYGKTSNRSCHKGLENLKKNFDKNMAGSGSINNNRSGYFDSDGKPIHGVTVNKKDVLTIPTKPYPEAHFATFPPKLIEPCILAGSKTGDVILDPFFGSGTTGEVAQNLGRQWIGCELNRDYMKLQKDRTLQMGMNI